MANQDFFLDPDDAQTMGNINFMRKSVQVRHTFPKTLANPNGLESFKNVSSLEDNSNKKVQESKSSQESSFSSPTFQASSNSTKSVPSSNDMNIFRNMARKIGKK